MLRKTVRFQLAIFLILTVMVCVDTAGAQNDLAPSVPPGTPPAVQSRTAMAWRTATAWTPTGTVLFNNGPFINSTGTGSGGTDESVLQDVSLGMNVLGFGHQISSSNRIADDFTVPAGGWRIDTITFFAYQTGSTTTSTINAVNCRIWDGLPAAPGSTVVFGDTTTNLLASTIWAEVYRVTETTTGAATNRPIMANTVNIGVTLPAGTYWVDWQVGGTLASGPWAPPITINGQAATGNGLQSVSGGAYFPVFDVASQQGFPFVICGQVPPPVAPALTKEGVIVFMLLISALACQMIRRRRLLNEKMGNP